MKRRNQSRAAIGTAKRLNQGHIDRNSYEIADNLGQRTEETNMAPAVSNRCHRGGEDGTGYLQDIPENWTINEIKEKLAALTISVPNTLSRKDMLRILKLNLNRSTNNVRDSSEGISAGISPEPRTDVTEPEAAQVNKDGDSIRQLQSDVRNLTGIIQNLLQHNSTSRSSTTSTTTSSRLELPEQTDEVEEISQFSSRSSPQALQDSILPNCNQLAVLDLEVDKLWDQTLAPSTLQTYKTGITCFKRFLLLYDFAVDVRILPCITEKDLIQFVTYCHSMLNISYSAIRSYLAGVRYFYVKQGSNHLWNTSLNLDQLYYILRAIKRSQLTPNQKRLPVTIELLSSMLLRLSRGCFSPYMDQLLLAILNLAFFGFLRCGEFTTNGKFDPNLHLCLDDISFSDDYSFMDVYLKSSKTDPFRKGIHITIFENKFNPVYHMLKYISLRKRLYLGKALFIVENSTPISREQFLFYFRSILYKIGIDSSKYSGHSFRIGAATSAAEAGIHDHMIQTLGRWKSSAYTRYIHTSKESIKNAQYTLSNY